MSWDFSIVCGLLCIVKLYNPPFSDNKPENRAGVLNWIKIASVVKKSIFTMPRHFDSNRLNYSNVGEVL